MDVLPVKCNINLKLNIWITVLKIKVNKICQKCLALSHEIKRRTHPLLHPEMVLQLELHGNNRYYEQGGGMGRTFTYQLSAGICSIGVHLQDIL